MRERRSDAFVRNGANGRPTQVLGIKCIADREINQMIFLLFWAQKGNLTRLHKPVSLKLTKLWSRGLLMWKKNSKCYSHKQCDNLQ